MAIKTERSLINGDRYQFDFGPCAAHHGFAQIDTDLDAWYYGHWANPHKRQIVSFVEGDLTIQTCDTDAEFISELNRTINWCIDQEIWRGIDALDSCNTRQKFIDLGFSSQLH